MSAKLKVALILGSVRTGRFCDKVAAWTKREIDAFGHFELEVVDPLSFPLFGASKEEMDATKRRLSETIGSADAYVVVTPEYNHGYPGALKLLIDSVYSEWNGKPIAFVSYGGIAGGLRAVEQLRQVFAEVDAMTIREAVSFHNPWKLFDAEANLLDANLANSVGKTMHTMLAKLKWWGESLKQARARVPYDKISNMLSNMENSAESDAKPYTLINTFYPKPDKRDEFLALQLDEIRRLSTWAGNLGWLGNRVYRAKQENRIVIITSFKSKEARQRHADSPEFLEHVERIRPLVERVESVEYVLVSENAP